MAEWTRKDIADAFGVSASAVNGDWTRDPSFPTAGRRGKAFTYQSSEVIRWYVNREVSALLGPTKAQDDSGAAPAEVFNLQQERARLARVQAEQKELELAVRRGELVGAGSARQVLAHAIGAARRILLSTHAQVASMHPGLPHTAIEQVRLLHRDALTALSEDTLPGDDDADSAA